MKKSCGSGSVTSAGGHAKDGVAVEHGVRGPYRSGHAVMGHLGHLYGLGFVQFRIGGHKPDGGILGRGRLWSRRQRDSPAALQPEFLIFFQFDFPGAAVFGVDDGSIRVDGHDSPHSDAVIKHDAGRPQSAFDAARKRTRSGADTTGGHRPAGGRFTGRRSPLRLNGRYKVWTAPQIIEDGRGTIGATQFSCSGNPQPFSASHRTTPSAVARP